MAKQNLRWNISKKVSTIKESQAVLLVSDGLRGCSELVICELTAIIAIPVGHSGKARHMKKADSYESERTDPTT